MLYSEFLLVRENFPMSSILEISGMLRMALAQHVFRSWSLLRPADVREEFASRSSGTWLLTCWIFSRSCGLWHGPHKMLSFPHLFIWFQRLNWALIHFSMMMPALIWGILSFAGVAAQFLVLAPVKRGSFRRWQQDCAAETVVSLGQSSVAHMLFGIAWHGQWSAEQNHAAQAWHAEIVPKGNSASVLSISCFFVDLLGGQWRSSKEQTSLDWFLRVFPLPCGETLSVQGSQANGP